MYCNSCQCLSRCNKYHHYFHFCQFHPIIKDMLNALIKDDRYLLENEVNERSQTHKLAEHLQYLLPKWNIDCEYNKKLDNKKTLNFDRIVNSVIKIIQTKNITDDHEIQAVFKALQEALKESVKIADEGDVDNETDSADSKFSFLQFTTSKGEKYIKKVFPDIIAHIRGTMENKIVIEAKREGNKNGKARWFDLIKLALFTEYKGEYGYDVGYFIDIPKLIPGKFFVNFKRNETLQQIIPYSNVWMVTIQKI